MNYETFLIISFILFLLYTAISIGNGILLTAKSKLNQLYNEKLHEISNEKIVSLEKEIISLKYSINMLHVALEAERRKNLEPTQEHNMKEAIKNITELQKELKNIGNPSDEALENNEDTEKDGKDDLPVGHYL